MEKILVGTILAGDNFNTPKFCCLEDNCGKTEPPTCWGRVHFKSAVTKVKGNCQQNCFSIHWPTFRTDSETYCTSAAFLSSCKARGSPRGLMWACSTDLIPHTSKILLITPKQFASFQAGTRELQHWLLFL